VNAGPSSHHQDNPLDGGHVVLYQRPHHLLQQVLLIDSRLAYIHTIALVFVKQVPPNDPEEVTGMSDDGRPGCQATVKGGVTVEVEGT